MTIKCYSSGIMSGIEGNLDQLAREQALVELIGTGVIDKKFANEIRAEDQARLHPSTSVSSRSLVGKIRGILGDVKALGQLGPGSQAAQIDWENQTRQLEDRHLRNKLIVNERLFRVNNSLDNAQQAACLGVAFVGGSVLSYLNLSLGVATSLAGFGLLYLTNEARGLPYRILTGQISFLIRELRSRQQATPSIPPPSDSGMVSLTT